MSSSSEPTESQECELATKLEPVFKKFRSLLKQLEDMEAWLAKVIVKSGYKGSSDMYSQEFQQEFELWIENLAANAPSSFNSGIVSYSRESQNSREVTEMSIPNTENPDRMRAAVFVREGQQGKVVVAGNATSSADVNAETTDNNPPSSAARLRSKQKQSKSSRLQTSEELRAIIREKFKAAQIQKKTESQPGTSSSHRNSDHPGVDELRPLESQNIHVETAANPQKSDSKKRGRTTKLKLLRPSRK